MIEQEEKNSHVVLIVILVGMVLFGVFQGFIVPMLKKEKKPVEETNSNTNEETEEERNQRIAMELYHAFALTLEEEEIFTPSDKTYLDDKLSLYRMSDDLKIYLAFKNLEDKYYTNEADYSLKDAIANATGNYYYSGKYVLMNPIAESVKKLFGDTPVTYKTISLPNTRYVYDERKNRYEIWVAKDRKEYSKEKVTYSEIVKNTSSIYVYEYVAYTDYTDKENPKTSTLHSGNLGVVITKDNVSDYLSMMDKYRYVFDLQEDGSYLFSAIEFMDE